MCTTPEPGISSQPLLERQVTNQQLLRIKETTRNSCSTMIRMSEYAPIRESIGKQSPHARPRVIYAENGEALRLTLPSDIIMRNAEPPKRQIPSTNNAHSLYPK